MISTRLCLKSLLFFTFCAIGTANKPPQFTKDLNNLILSESTEVGSIIGRLEGSDPENSDVSFGILGNDVFEVNSTTGKLILT